MEKFAVLILCSSFYSIRATGCNPDLAPCSDVHDIATITCAENGAGCEIKCGPTEGDCPEGGVLDGLLGEAEDKIDKIDAGICKEMCRKQATAAAAETPSTVQCEFYRWEEKGEGSKCFLQTVCEPDVRCQPDEPNHRCVTGQIGCTEDGTMACSLDEVVAYDHEKFHLICHGDANSPGDINIYSPDYIHDIPTGTECYTIHMCDVWTDFSEGDKYYRKLAVSCSDEGTWVKLEPTGDGDDSKNMIVENTLVEPTCGSVCDSMTLDGENIHAEGTELICEEALSGVNLENGNSCILICDNHFSMSISCEFEYEGTKAWMNQNREPVTGEAVKC